MTLCWILNNLSYYHAARIRAFAAKAQTPPWVIEWTDRDEFPSLENRGSEPSPFRRLTLFSGMPLGEIRMSAAKQALRSALDSLAPSVVCVNGWGVFGSRTMLAWCIRRRVPAVLMSESTAHDKLRSWWVEAAKRRIVALYSAALVGGSPHHNYLIKLGFPSSRIFTGYDVVDNDHFSRGVAAARQTPGLREKLGFEAPYFLACSRFSEKKNLLRLIRAYAAYRKVCRGPAWKLLILGDGEMRGEMQALRRDLEVVSDVLMPGAKGYDELPLFYGLAGAFVHASTSEPWGLVANEAMASGLPVIISERCGCAPDLVVNGQNGFTFDPLDTNRLADLMSQVSSGACDLQRMGDASRLIIARWSPESFAESLLAAVAAASSSPLRRPKIHDYLPLWER
jgi:glycosyltransferase involved in cell wall biosynthesis